MKDRGPEEYSGDQYEYEDQAPPEDDDNQDGQNDSKDSQPACLFGYSQAWFAREDAEGDM